ncbi:MAG: precorrin-2 C(20)-methyltransferase [Thermoleophilia bacterium]
MSKKPTFRQESHADPETGTLYGVGVGPGDPGLVTVRAVEIIQSVVTVAYPVHRQGAGSRALEAVRRYLRDGAALLPLLMPMTRDRERLRQAHAAAAAELAAAGGSGSVAYLSLGDPLFYSTFAYLAGGYPGSVRMISGVSAVSATAAAAGLPLATGDTPMVVVSGADTAGLRAALGMAGASVIIIKPRALKAAAFDLLDAAGVWQRTCAAVELGGEDERVISPLDRREAERLPYFAVIWIQPLAETEEAFGSA